MPYNEVMKSRERVMTVSRNGQVSIPAETRARWNTRQVVVVDLGDRVVMRPMSDAPIAALKGKYAGRGPSADAARTQERTATRSRERS
jgi:AbrB family looped-hinge helix DNA binding protein